MTTRLKFVSACLCAILASSVSTASAQEHARSCSIADYPGADVAVRLNDAAKDSRCNEIDATSLKGEQKTETTIVLSRPVHIRLGALQLTSSAVPVVRITSGGVHLSGDGSLTVFRGTPAKTEVAPMLQADFEKQSQADEITVEGIAFNNPELTFQRVYRRVMMFRNVRHVHVLNNRFTGFDLPPSQKSDLFVIWFNSNVTDSEISGNKIDFPQIANPTDVAFRIGILAQSPVVDNENGMVSGLEPLPSNVHGVVISDNEVIRGTHGINLKNSTDIKVLHNSLSRQGHRGLIFIPTNSRVQILDNTVKDSGSCNLIMDYGNRDFVIRGNTFDRTLGAEGRNIELYLGNSNVSILDNTLLNAWNDAIYIGHLGDHINIAGNKIRDYSNADSGHAGIRIEGTMRKGYPEMFRGGGLDEITIENNTISNRFGGTRPGIYIQRRQPDSAQRDAQIGVIKIDGNDVTGGRFAIQTVGLLPQTAVSIGSKNRLHANERAVQNDAEPPAK